MHYNGYVHKKLNLKNINMSEDKEGGNTPKKKKQKVIDLKTRLEKKKKKELIDWILKNTKSF